MPKREADPDGQGCSRKSSAPPVALTPQQRKTRASLAANARWSRPGERRRQSEAIRNARLDRHENIVDPDRQLDPDERRRLAENSMRAEMTALSLKASKARQAKQTAS